MEDTGEDKVLAERKDQIVQFLKKDKWVSTFVIITAISLLFSFLVKVGFTTFIGVVPAKLWLVLAIFSAISAIIAYYKQYKFTFYPILAWLVWLAVYIRTLNLPGLRDITTGGWTLGPDLDPFLFLRWAKDIVAQGALASHDALRYVPIGFNTHGELSLLSYLIAWFHKLAASFGSTSVEQSASLFPVFMFALTVIAFFLLVRKIFLSSLGETKSSIIALISAFFFSVIPSFIPRTIAGIPEKESAAFLFFFLALYFFLCSWNAEKLRSRIIFALLAGAASALMALVWGGYLFVFIAIGLTTLIAFLIGQTDLNKFYSYAIWIVSFALFTLPFTERYTLIGWIVSPATGIAFATLGIIIVDLLIHKTTLKKYFSSEKLSKIPPKVLSIIVTAILGILAISVAFGPMFLVGEISDISGHMLTPVTDRLGVTVAENKQPFFSEWADNFGPSVKGIPITFWLMFIGSIYLFYMMMKSSEKKERIVLTIGYLVWLTCIIFSRYSSGSSLNGTNPFSTFVYFFGFIVLMGVFGYYYYQGFKSGSEKFKSVEFSLLLMFSLFFICIVAARGAVRTVMMLVPPAAIIISYFAVESFSSVKRIKDSTAKTVSWILVALIILSTVFAGYQFYKGSAGMAQGYAPSVYNQQWQQAMSWVRTSTPQNAVFGHWWDYGYWVQSMGERATVLDGGNQYAYWDHLMGRYGLTSSNETQTLEFLYAHNTTHFLIDSTDIGKYSAFSSIGGDENCDRNSWIQTFGKDERQTQETKNSTLSVYTGGFPLDSDIIYNDNGTKIFLPARSANTGLAGIIVERDLNGTIMTAPIGVFVNQGKQIRIPLRYAFEKNLTDFHTGLEAGIFLVPVVQQSAQGFSMVKDGALMYLSDRTVMSQVARLYLYNENDPYFKLAHSEDDFFVAQLKAANATDSDFVVYGGLRGPIRIWEINYPKNIKFNPAFMETTYPNDALLKKLCN